MENELLLVKIPNRNGNIYIVELTLIQLTYAHFLYLIREKYYHCNGCLKELRRRIKNNLITIIDVENLKVELSEIKEKQNINSNNFLSELFSIYYN